MYKSERESERASEQDVELLNHASMPAAVELLLLLLLTLCVGRTHKRSKHKQKQSARVFLVTDVLVESWNRGRVAINSSLYALRLYFCV